MYLFSRGATACPGYLWAKVDKSHFCSMPVTKVSRCHRGHVTVSNVFRAKGVALFSRSNAKQRKEGITFRTGHEWWEVNQATKFVKLMKLRMVQHVLNLTNGSILVSLCVWERRKGDGQAREQYADTAGVCSITNTHLQCFFAHLIMLKVQSLFDKF